MLVWRALRVAPSLVRPLAPDIARLEGPAVVAAVVGQWLASVTDHAGCEACGTVVKALDSVFNCPGFDSHSAMCYKSAVKFESTLHLATQQLWVPGAQIQGWIDSCNYILCMLTLLREWLRQMNI